jgi:uncharacterized protein (TIGR02996 family)
MALALEVIARALDVSEGLLLGDELFATRTIAPGFDARRIARIAWSWYDSRNFRFGGGAALVDVDGRLWYARVDESGSPLRIMTQILEVTGPAPQGAPLDALVPIADFWGSLGLTWEAGIAVQAPSGFAVERVRDVPWRTRPGDYAARGALARDERGRFWFASQSGDGMNVVGPTDAAGAFEEGFVPRAHVESDREAFEAARLRWAPTSRPRDTPSSAASDGASRRTSSTPDGRYHLRYRQKDEWGDFDNSEERWTLVDDFGCELTSWTGAREEDDGATEAAFAPDFRAVVARYRDGRTQRYELPTPADHPEPARALRAAIFAAPDDDAPRLVYADWLQDRGDPRGEMIALAMLAPEHQRLTELLQRHALGWQCDDGLPLSRDCRFARGFVESLRVQLFDAEHVARLLGQPALACVRELDVSYSTVGDPLAARIAACRHLAWLRSLDLGLCSLTDAGVAALAGSPNLPRLERVDVSGNHTLTAGALDLLAGRGWLQGR